MRITIPPLPGEFWRGNYFGARAFLANFIGRCMLEVYYVAIAAGKFRPIVVPS